MNISRIFIVLIIAVSALHTEAKTFQNVFKDFQNLELHPENCYKIENATLSRYYGNYDFEKGTVAFAKALNGKIIAAVFTGDGVFSYHSNSKVEEEHLVRYLGKNLVYERFKTAVFFFGDSTYSELNSHIIPQIEYEGMEDLQDYLLDGIEYLVDEDEEYISSPLMRALLEEKYFPYFLGIINIDDQKNSLMCQINPAAEEEFSFNKDIYDPHGSSWETINQYQLRIRTTMFFWNLLS